MWEAFLVVVLLVGRPPESDPGARSLGSSGIVCVLCVSVCAPESVSVCVVSVVSVVSASVSVESVSMSGVCVCVCLRLCLWCVAACVCGVCGVCVYVCCVCACSLLLWRSLELGGDPYWLFVSKSRD